jgi:hypothetical protein
LCGCKYTHGEKNLSIVCAEIELTFKHEQQGIRGQGPQGISSTEVQLVCAWACAVALPCDLHAVWLINDINKDTVGKIPLEVGEAGYLDK